MNLSMGQMNENQKGRVKGLRACEPAYRKKLLAMGLIKQTEFTVIRKAPLGDPIEIRIKDYNLLLRKDEADVILVETGSQNEKRSHHEASDQNWNSR